MSFLLLGLEGAALPTLGFVEALTVQRARACLAFDGPHAALALGSAAAAFAARSAVAALSIGSSAASLSSGFAAASLTVTSLDCDD